MGVSYINLNHEWLIMWSEYNVLRGEPGKRPDKNNDTVEWWVQSRGQDGLMVSSLSYFFFLPLV